MRARPDDLSAMLGAMLAGALLTAGACLIVLTPAGLPSWSYFFLLPALIYAAPLILALAGRLDTAPARSSAGDLDHLLDLKRSASLPPARRTTRRTGGPLLRPTPAPLVAPTPPGALDRLVQRKREWTGADAADANDMGDPGIRP
jgi:hypothetical protein